jgi:hypothetical protein
VSDGKPLPPDVLVDALQDVVHEESTEVRGARTSRGRAEMDDKTKAFLNMAREAGELLATVPASIPMCAPVEDSMDDKKRLEEIEARAKAATPGPWVREDDWMCEVNAELRELGVDHVTYENVVKLVAGLERICFNGSDDADFIAHAREDVPWLLSQLAQVQAERDQERARWMDATVAGTPEEAASDLEQLEAERDKVQADCAVLREALVERYHDGMSPGCGSGYYVDVDDHSKGRQPCDCGADEHNAKVRAALSTDAGPALLRERDELRAKVAMLEKRLVQLETRYMSCSDVHPEQDVYHPGGHGTMKTVMDERDALKKRVADLEAVAAAARRVRRGCDCEYDYRCGRCQAAIGVKTALANLDATTEGSDK